ncbi:MAG: DNA-binding response regulator [Gammaproteobacteria bacterium]|nr:MAG: DNA-binding response regulator [Gammaproteobacteria bacterium]RKZ96864.1 MAG: DNA-binding response regulator [Gammaproteobacteria bacterium]
MSTIRILLVDDHSLFRTGIKSLLESQDGFEVVGEASDGLEGVKRAKQLKPNVVLLDLHMPGTSGLDALQMLTEDVPETEVLMLTVSEDAQDLMQALRSGARGYLLKNIEIEFLIDSIRRAVKGESVMSPQMSVALVDAVREPSIEKEPEKETVKLTPRESEIIIMLAQGESNKSIARTLGLAESTVKIHVQGILRKLKITSRVQAAVYAVEHGLMPKS